MEDVNNSKKGIILSLCSGTGSWERPYVEAGFRVESVTLPDKDVMNYELPDEEIYGILAAPPCTHFSIARTVAKTPRDLRGGMAVVHRCLELIWEAQYRIEHDQQKRSPLKFWALENPASGFLKWFLGEPSFCFDPWQFGDGYRKKTALWGLFNKPPVLYDGKASDFTSINNIKLSSIHLECDLKLDRAGRKSITPKGFAKEFFKANSG